MMAASSIARHPSLRRATLAVVPLTLVLVASAVIHLGLGARTISPRTVVEALLNYDPRNFDHRIIVSLRLTRLIAALLTGAALGVAGMLLQTIIRNPLGEPHILGLNAGATLAVVICSALGVSSAHWGVMQPLVAACGAGGLFALVMFTASAGRSGPTAMKITLCGVALSAFASAVSAAILILDEQTLQAMRTWLAGDLAGVSQGVLRIAVIPMATGLLMAMLLASRISQLALGDNVARGLGVNVTRTRALSVVAIALLCGGAVTVAGPIGFIGLVVPHIVHYLAGHNLRSGLLLAMPVGAALLLIADIFARWLLAPQELATGVMTALVGAPLFILIAVRFFK
ncbi:iron ABC transporter permease [Pseudocitrobacter sp. 2023EL-00150]|uniref:FecCD family ABC transporter permease n=2 Tax=unclassified Pseudocitrobacter TaxID=2638778 RepID=UPI0023E386B0|nr:MULTISPECIES: iron ABC transporter permease [unclassified Pseudocitrobacter]MDF3827677.1 iron ABC transporter permease [Pseudocitrobacter sp. 2023EL-00150]MEC5374063.1 iron ABC transporter permease [Pseudocitrobacter sp. MW920760]